MKNVNFDLFVSGERCGLNMSINRESIIAACGYVPSELITAYYEGGIFYEDSSKSVEIQGASDKVYIDNATGGMFVWDQALSQYKAVGGSLDVYTKSETDNKIIEKVSEIVAGAPEDFDTLKEMSDWIANHEGSAAAMNAAINNKVDKEEGKGLSHNDFTDYYKTAVEAIPEELQQKADLSHTHSKSDITDFPEKLPASDVYPWAKDPQKPSYSWREISGKPSVFPPESHSHAWSSITGKPSTYTPESHTHSLNDVSELVDKLSSLSGTAGRADSRSEYCVEQINDHIKPTLETKADSGHTHTINGVSFNGSANIIIPRSTKHVHVASGTEGSVGYVKIATIKITGEFANHPVEFVISQRSRGPYHLYVQFNSVSSTDPTLYQFKHFDPANKSVKAYIVKSATSTWDIYIEKVEAYDHIYILDVLKADGNEGVQYTITYTNVQASSVPTTNQTKSTAVSFNGNASSATKLTTSAGSATVPVYFSGGVPTECTYELNKTVPADAVFTDGCIDQRNSSGNFNLPLLLGFNNDTNVNGFAWKNSKFTANPSTGELTATTFNGSVAWGNVTGKPSSYTPSSHSHSMSDISNLNTTIDSLSSTLNSINTALTLHKVLKPFTKSSDQPDLIVRGESYVQYNDYLWKFNLFFTNAKNIQANTETVIATTSYPPKYTVVKTGVTIWKNDNSTVHTNNATVKIKSNGDITITTPTTISGTGVNYARMNGEIFTAVNF